MNIFKKPKEIIVFAELDERFLHVRGETEVHLPIDRDETGFLTASGKQMLEARLKEWIGTDGGRVKVWCALPLRGVSLRHLQLPAVKSEEMAPILRFQVEKLFPLPLQEMAWLVKDLKQVGVGGWEGSVFGVRKAFMMDLEQVLARCGWQVSFTLSILTLMGEENGDGLFYKVTTESGDWIRQEGGRPLQVGFHASDKEASTRADRIAMLLKAQGQETKVHLLGEQSMCEGIRDRLQTVMGSTVNVQIKPCTEVAPALAAMKNVADEEGNCRLPIFESFDPTVASRSNPRRDLYRWAAVAGLLFLISLSMKFVQPMLRYEGLSEDYAALEAKREGLPDIGKELGFLQFLEQNRSPYLETVHILSRTAPPNSLIEILVMNRRGDISIRCSVQNGKQVGEFRSKLIDSGYFYPVVVDEQTKGNQSGKLQVRITARWKPADERKPLPESWLIPDPANKTGPNLAGPGRPPRQPF